MSRSSCIFLCFLVHKLCFSFFKYLPSFPNKWWDQQTIILACFFFILYLLLLKMIVKLLLSSKEQVQGLYKQWTNHLCIIKSCRICMSIPKTRSAVCSSSLIGWGNMFWPGETAVMKALAAPWGMWTIWMQHHNLFVSGEINHPPDVLEHQVDTPWLCALLHNRVITG